VTTIGIISDPQASSGKSKAIKDLIEENGFDVIIIGSDVDLSSPEMRELMRLDGLTILDERHQRVTLREPKIAIAERSCGPRNRWGALK
jgi:hypothetical protein